MYAVVVFDNLEYQYRPLFADRDAGEVKVFGTRKEAEAEAAFLRQWSVRLIDATVLPLDAMKGR